MSHAPLNVLLVEDAELDAELILHALRRAGFAPAAERVWAADPLRAALAKGPWDIVISDYRLPTFSALDVLRIVRERDPDLPFILVSGAVGEELAVEVMKAGAQDVVMKDLLARLGPAVRREMADAEVRRKKREAEEGLKRLCEELERRVAERTAELTQAAEERNRMFVRLLRGQKLQAIGQLAAGVAHEINNPVAWILSNLSTIERDLGPFPAGSDLAEALRDCKDGCLRIRDIVASLKSFARPDEPEFEACKLLDVLEQSLKLAGSELKYRADVVRDFAEIPAIPGRPQQLEQVFINLLVNAAQAIPERGEIRVSLVREGDEAVVRVKDSGVGIAPEHLPRLFEPFFTTKPVGKGTGLGLHVAYKIVRAHGGRLTLRSKPGEGCEATVRLPFQAPSSRPVVLVVDGDSLRLRDVRRLFRGEPFRLMTTRHPERALEWLDTRDVRLVLSDHAELLKEVERRSPDTRCLPLASPWKDIRESLDVAVKETR